MPEMDWETENMLLQDCYCGQNLSAMYHRHVETVIENERRGCHSIGSFRHNTGQSRYWSQRGRDALFQLIGDGSVEANLDPAECEAF